MLKQRIDAGELGKHYTLNNCSRDHHLPLYATNVLNITLCCAVLCCAALHCIALHCIALYVLCYRRYFS